MKIIRATKTFLTPRQRIVLNFITSFLSEKGYSPTQQEVADFLQKERSYAQKVIIALINKGYIRLNKNSKRRNLEVIMT